MRAGLVVAALLGGCSSVVYSNGIPVYAKLWQGVEAEITPRAQIDLGCQSVGVLLLRRQGKVPVDVSAKGCGRTVVYHRELRHHLGHYTTKNTVWQLVSTSHLPPPRSSHNPYEVAAE